MRGFGQILGAVALLAGGMAAQLTPSPSQQQAIVERERASKPERKRRQIGLAEVGPRWKRSRGAQAKPKHRPNRLIIGKRVRRKHRRARQAA